LVRGLHDDSRPFTGSERHVRTKSQQRGCATRICVRTTPSPGLVRLRTPSRTGVPVPHGRRHYQPTLSASPVKQLTSRDHLTQPPPRYPAPPLLVRRNSPATRNAADGISFSAPHGQSNARDVPAPLPSMTDEHRARARCRIRPTTAEPLAAPQPLNRRASLKGMRRKARRGLNIPGAGAAARGPKPLLSRGGSERRE